MCIVYYTILDYASYRRRYNIFSVREAFQSKIPAVFKHVFTKIAKIKATWFKSFIVAQVDWRMTGSLHIKYKNIHVCFLFLFLFSFSRPSASLCEYFVLTYFY